MADTLPTTAPAPAAPAPPAYAHPVAAFFLFFFKAAAIFIYIFCGWFGTDFVINFCLITFLLVCDFWTVRGAGAAAAGLCVLCRCCCRGWRFETLGRAMHHPACPALACRAGQERERAADGGPALVERGVGERRLRLEV